MTEVAGVRPGDVLASKYRVERVLGAGGMGIVVAAHHLQLDQKVALKFLLPAALKNKEAVARFVREARTAVRIKSEHVANVTDVGELENGAPYMVMEYLEGGDLDAWLRERGPLPIEQAVEFVLQACVAVADAHALGVVHRDLKPANLFCVRRTDGQLSIKVLDFGISKVTSPEAQGAGAAMTRTSAMMGTPLYMSPEQMSSSKNVDARADIWALGVILYELLTGQSPFLAESVMELAVKIATAPLPPLQGFRPDAPPGLEAVIARCVEKDPARRYANVGELAIALYPFGPRRARTSVDRISGIIQAAGLSASALALPPSPPVAATRASAGTLPPLGRTTAGAPPPKTAALAIAAFAAIAFGATVMFAYVARRPATQPDTAAATTAPSGPPTLSTVNVAVSTLPASTTVSLSPLEPAATAALPTTSMPPVTAAPHPLANAAAPSGLSKSVSKVAAPTVTTPATLPPPSPIGAPAPPPSGLVAATPDCNPPYTINAAGHRVHKEECP